MPDTDVQIAFCGSAGDGTIAVGDIFKRAMARAGYKVIAFDIYPPEIRGFGKCIARVRITTEQVYSLKRRTILPIPSVASASSPLQQSDPLLALARGTQAKTLLPGLSTAPKS